MTYPQTWDHVGSEDVYYQLETVRGCDPRSFQVGSAVIPILWLLRSDRWKNQNIWQILGELHRLYEPMSAWFYLSASYLSCKLLVCKLVG